LAKEVITESNVKKINEFAGRRPFLFVIFLILSSLIVEIVAGILIAVLLHVKQSDPIFAPVVLFITTLYLVSILWSFGWVKAAGVASLGSWKGWGVALVLLIYYLLELIFSFFGEFTFTVPIAAVSGLRVPSTFLVAVFEELLFRGFVLYALVRVWGATRKGVVKAVIISAFLFSTVHALNAISGNPSESLGQMAIALFESIWLAAIVLRWGSIWPVVFVHGVTNWVLQTKALGYTDYHGTANSYAFAVLLGLPLVALGISWILRGSLWYQYAVKDT
jgi:membrane protease YdiL (CAAX protease family)